MQAASHASTLRPSRYAGSSRHSATPARAATRLRRLEPPLRYAGSSRHSATPARAATPLRRLEPPLRYAGSSRHSATPARAAIPLRRLEPPLRYVTRARMWRADRALRSEAPPTTLMATKSAERKPSGELGSLPRTVKAAIATSTSPRSRAEATTLLCGDCRLRAMNTNFTLDPYLLYGPGLKLKPVMSLWTFRDDRVWRAFLFSLLREVDIHLNRLGKCHSNSRNVLSRR